MANEPSWPAGTTSIAVNDFLEWLSTHNADNAVCPMCGYTKWNVLTDKEQLAMLGFMPFPATAGNMGWGKPAVQVECQRCSFMALFSARSVADWISKGKPTFDGDAGNGQ